MTHKSHPMPKLGKRNAIASCLALGIGAGMVASVWVWTPGAVFTWCGGIVTAAVVAYLSHDAPGEIRERVARRRQEAAGPLTVTVHIKDQDYVTVTDGDRTVDVPASGHTVQLVVTGASPSPVVLSALRPEVLGRDHRFGDLARHAAAIPLRRFEVLLDPDPPQLRALESIDFPFQVKRDELEVLDLLVTAESGVVRWVLWLDWSAGGKTGSLRIDLGGQAFKTAARHPSLPSPS
jgi:hypothetical protein